MTDVKICGLTRTEDVELACALGARYLGFNFARGSPRRVSVEAAADLAAAASPGIVRVGVFVDETAEEIRRAARAASLDLVQIHRTLCGGDLASTPRPVVAVSRVGVAGEEPPSDALLALCRAVLFDTASDGLSGGTGRAFDWEIVARRAWPVPVFLAGGLRAGNVGAAIAQVRPAAVDVASGVESAPGIKDRVRLARFFEAVREADEAHAKSA